MALHFAYGSNLDREQMKCRCPQHRYIGIAKKAGYKLAFTRWSNKRKGGVADIVESEGDEVWGAIYELIESDIESLDKCEGVNSKAYQKEENFEVLDTDGRLVKAYVYIANKQGCFKPHKDYICQIIKGAQTLDLPEAYISKLQSISYLGD